MRSYSVSARGLSAVQVRGPNWIVALGSGLEALGKSADVQRLACEVLPNGTVIARDITTGTGYVVQEVQASAEDVQRPVDGPGELPLTPHGAPDGEEPFALGEEITQEEELELLPPDAIEIVPEDDPLELIGAAESSLAACRRALELARKRVEAESGAVILEEMGYLRFIAVEGPHARKLVGVRLPLGTGVAGFAMEKRRTVVLAEAHADPRHCGEVDALTGYTTEQIAVVPVVAADQVFGVLEVMNLPEGRRFSEQDVDELAEVAVALAERLAGG